MNFANKSVTIFLLVLIAILVACLAYALTAGNIDQSGPVLFGSPWGIMTLVDLYVGFLIFAVFIAATAKTPAKAVLWIVGSLLLGNIITALYLILWLNSRKTTYFSRIGLAESANKH